MSTYILRRLLLTAPVVIGILFTTFLIKAAIPSDAVVTMYQGQLSEQDASKAIAIMRHKYGLDRPWYMQFLCTPKACSPAISASRSAPASR